MDGLLDVIKEIAIHGSAASDRRRSDGISCKTLDDLNSALKESGYFISRTGLYRRLVLLKLFIWKKSMNRNIIK
jgi:hypothetical protein